LLTALYYNLVEDSQRQLVFDKLLQNIKANNYHLDCGIMGSKYIFNVLAEGGKIDVAYKIANQKTYPSYGLWIENGATTLHEDWGSASSLNHIMFGDISAWFYKNLAGIKADINNPGFKHIIIEPQPVGDLKWVKAKYHCLYGEIKSQWKLEDDRFELTVSIPFNTTATIFVPADTNWAKDNFSKILQNQDTGLIEVTEGKVIFNVGSGSYAFKSKFTL
jgi:alpha-L-rhamnosidase